MIDEKKFTSLVNRRTAKINKRADAYDVLRISPDIIKQLFVESINNGLICPYCNEKIELFAKKYDVRRAISVDHTVPLSTGGKNTMDNLKICCTRCNLAKGTMSEEKFVVILNTFKERGGHNEMIAYLEESYKSGLAHKIDRLKGEI